MASVQQPILDLDDLLSNWNTTEASSGIFYSDEIWIDTISKVFYFLGGGNLATAGSGPTGQALYSLFKERWKVTAELPQYAFPMLSITNEQFEIQNGWKPAQGENVGTSSASDITFAIATDDTITSAADFNFQSLGFTNKDHIVITGSTDNDGYYRIKSVSGGVITLEGSPLPGTAGADTATITFYRNAVYQSGSVYSTREMIRTAGWTEVDGSDVDRRYAGVVTLGTFVDPNSDQAYYVQNNSFTAAVTNTSYTGPVNQAVQFYGNVDYGDTYADDFIGNVGTVTINPTSVTFTATNKIDFGAAHAFSVGDLIKVTGATTASNNKNYKITDADPDGDGQAVTVFETVTTETVGGSAVTATLVGYVRDDYFKIFVRERGKSYADADLPDIGVTELTYIVYRFPVTNTSDLNINTTDDSAITGATISSISDSSGVVTVDTTGAHGLYVGAPVDISGTGQSYDGIQFIISTVPDANTFTFEATQTGSANAGTTKLGGVDTIEVRYIANPDTLTGDVVIRGDWSNTATYALGDVVYDAGNSSLNADGDRWYFLDATTAGGVPLSTAVDISEDTNNTWTLWDPATTYAGALGGQRNIEEDADGGGVNGTWSAYTVELDANDLGTTPGASKETIYEVAQYRLRQTGNINDNNANSSTRNGNIADPLVFFVGSTLNTYRDPDVTTPGPFAVLIDDIGSTDVNNVQFNEAVSVDGGTRSTSHSKPIVVSVTFNFNDNLVNDPAAVFYAYYSSGFGTTGALQLQRTFNGVASDVGSDLSPANEVPDSGTYSFNYAYASDTTGGRTPSQPVNITVVAIGLDTGQYVITSGNITEAGGTFSLVAPLERNYTDPNG